MDGTWCRRVTPALTLTLAAAAAGGCSTFDTAHEGVIDGRPWRERVAREVNEEHVGALYADLKALVGAPTEEPDDAVPASQTVRLFEILPTGERVPIGEPATNDADDAEAPVAALEARRLAETAVAAAAELADAYGFVTPIELHNSLVNLGLRPRGKCYQYAEDLFARLDALELTQFDLYWAVADKGDLLHEHSAVVATAKGQPFSEGIVLDGWRHAGKLRWAHVRDDRYPWVDMTEWKFGAPAAEVAGN